MAGIEAIDTQLLKVPFEALKREATKRRSLIEGLQDVARQVSQARQDASISRESAMDLLRKLLQDIEELKEKHDALAAAEARELQRLEARAAHLAEIRPLATSSVVAWNERRLPRLLVDHLFREGHFETAQALMEGCEDLCDWHIFREAQTIMQHLKGKDCSAAFAWCNANNSRLRRAKSELLFQLHVQEFVELIKRGSTKFALKYACEHLQQFADENFSEFKRAMALLVFGPSTTCPRYLALLHVDRWADLCSLFMQALLRINNLTPVSLFEIQLQAGLTALKCPLSYEDGCTREDPLHLPEMKALAADLPWAKHVTSKLVCSVTLSVMDDNNPPWVLPNGYVYSQRALDLLERENNGKIICPVTGEVCLRENCVPAYIV